MSEEKRNPKQENDPKARFREALEKKKNSRGVRNNTITSNAKVSGGQTSGNTQKMFRRKSGST